MSVKTPHKHAELIKAWADGATIQENNYRLGKKNWYEILGTPCWNNDVEYRIMPEPKSLGQLMGEAWGMDWKYYSMQQQQVYENAAVKFLTLYNEQNSSA